MPDVTFSSVGKTYGGTRVIEDLDLTLGDGSFTVLVGPSGCGKSTTLRMLAGLEAASCGQIRIGERDVTALEPRERDVAMVFQNYALYPHLSVEENIAFPLRARGEDRRAARTKARDAATYAGISELLDRRPRQLSGGQQQRVAIARAIVRKPSVFLFDEPLSNLDAKLRVEMRSEILRIQRAIGATALYVTHDQEEAMTLSDQMVVMRNGAIAQIGTPAEIYAKPANTFVAGFVGSPKMNLIDGEIVDGVLHTRGGFRLPLPGAAPGAVTVGIRPEDLTVEAVGPNAQQGGDAEGTVELTELVGPRVIVSLCIGDDRVKAVIDTSEAAGIAVGAAVAVSVRRGAYHRFESGSGDRVEDQ